jgi:hypothetical protein
VSDHIYMCKGINIYILSTILGFGTVLKEWWFLDFNYDYFIWLFEFVVGGWTRWWRHNTNPAPRAGVKMAADHNCCPDSSDEEIISPRHRRLNSAKKRRRFQDSDDDSSDKNNSF